MKILFRICIAMVVASACIGAFAVPIHAETSEAGNTYISGSILKITDRVPGDLFAAGSEVRIDQEVGADAAIAGGTVEVRAPVKQDLRVAGRNVDINANIGGELVAAGGTVNLENTSAVAGAAWLAGNDVLVAGKIGKGAKIHANKITLSGQINGDTHIYGKEINFLPGAKINGNLSYASPVPLEQNIAAQVSGTTTRESMSEGNTEWTALNPVPWLLRGFLVFSMLVAGALLALLFPNAVSGTQRVIRQYPLRSALAGLALLFVVPPVAIMLVISIIGMPIGFALFALYPLMLLLGYLAAAFFIGRQAADTMKQPQHLGFGKQLLFLALALVILSAITWIPFLGGAILIVALVTGIGGWAVWMYLQYSGNKVAPN